MDQSYSVAIGQCTKLMRKDLETHPRYKNISEDQYVINLLKVICTAMYNYNSHKYQPQAIHKAVRPLYTIQQSRDMDVQTYFGRIETQVDVIDTVGGRFSNHPFLSVAVLEEILDVGVGGDNSTATKDQEDKANNISRDRYLGCLAVMNPYMRRYGVLKIDLENNAFKRK